MNKGAGARSGGHRLRSIVRDGKYRNRGIQSDGGMQLSSHGEMVGLFTKGPDGYRDNGMRICCADAGGEGGPGREVQGGRSREEGPGRWREVLEGFVGSSILYLLDRRINRRIIPKLVNGRTVIVLSISIAPQHEHQQGKLIT